MTNFTTISQDFNLQKLNINNDNPNINIYLNNIKYFLELFRNKNTTKNTIEGFNTFIIYNNNRFYNLIKRLFIICFK